MNVTWYRCTLKEELLPTDYKWKLEIMILPPSGRVLARSNYRPHSHINSAPGCFCVYILFVEPTNFAHNVWQVINGSNMNVLYRSKPKIFELRH